MFKLHCFCGRWEQYLLQILVIYTTSSRRHILDALPMLGSNAAIAVMKDVILRNGVSQDVAHEWLLTLSFIPRYLL
jgi:hypothetical protein